MLTASVVLPLMYIAGAVFIGDGTAPPTGPECAPDGDRATGLGYLSVPIAWAIGYPLAFAVLIYFALHTLDWTTRAMVRSVIGVIGCLLGAGAFGFAAHWILGGQSDALRLGGTAAVYVVAMGFLLAYTQGISLRSASRSLKGDDAA
jgi:hypothetical protein